MGGVGGGGSGSGGAVGRVEVISSKGCSKLLVGISSSLPSVRGLQTFESMSPALSSARRSDGPFSGLVICVTGLSKGGKLLDFVSKVLVLILHESLVFCFFVSFLFTFLLLPGLPIKK